MAVGTIYKCVFSNICTAGQCCGLHSPVIKVNCKLLSQHVVANVQLCYHRTRNQYFHRTAEQLNRPRLSPQEVTSILRANEHTQEFISLGSIKSYDSNQLPSNQPIEDARCEARSLLTTGMLVGVFDGHGGAACAQVVAKRLMDYVAISLLPSDLLDRYLHSLDLQDGPMPLLESFNDRYDLVDELKGLYSTSLRKFVEELTSENRKDFQMSDALERAFLRLDTDFTTEVLESRNISNGGSSSALALKTLSVGLSGAVACVAHIDGPHLHVASVGDCQAVLGVLADGPSGTWVAKKVSIEHNTDNPDEVARILREHPNNERDTVIRMERLLGQLAPLRAFGDVRYKWQRSLLSEIVAPHLGDQAVAPNYYTPPYLTARPDVTHHRLTPRDRFLVIASDGLWDLVSPLQAVRLVGEHMSGKVTLSPLRLPRKEMRISDINSMLVQRQRGLKKKPQDRNAATHLLRHALGGTEYGVEHSKIAQLLSMPREVVRLFRDDITVTVVFFDSEYLRHCPP